MSVVSLSQGVFNRGRQARGRGLSGRQILEGGVWTVCLPSARHTWAPPPHTSPKTSSHSSSALTSRTDKKEETGRCLGKSRRRKGVWCVDSVSGAPQTHLGTTSSLTLRGKASIWWIFKNSYENLKFLLHTLSPPHTPPNRHLQQQGQCVSHPSRTTDT